MASKSQTMTSVSTLFWHLHSFTRSHIEFYAFHFRALAAEYATLRQLRYETALRQDFEAGFGAGRLALGHLVRSSPSGTLRAKNPGISGANSPSPVPFLMPQASHSSLLRS